MLSPEFHQLHDVESASLASEAAAGLLASAAHASPKFFYDALGSRLFDAITELDEYYPTRTEAAIFSAEMGAIAAAVRQRLGADYSLIDLGAGNCAKAARLFDALAPRRYVAVDISVEFLRESVECLQGQHPRIEMVGVGLDFSAQLALPAALRQGQGLVFYPGSSIGNFDPRAALRLLREAHALADNGMLLIGVDLVKPAGVLEAAYDDSLGVTAAFNLNLLRHLNRLIGSDFHLREWQHVALFNREDSRIEMHLQARHAITVRWPGAQRRFAAGERIHTENSYKWRRADFESLLREAGFRDVRAWTDPNEWYALVLAR